MSPAGAPARPDAAERAGLRLAGAGVGLLLLGLLVGPVAVLVHESWAPLVRLDDAVNRAAERAGTRLPVLQDLAAVLTHLGDPALLSVAALLAALVLVRRGHRRLALYVVLSRLGAALLSSTMKAAVGRARPEFDVPVASAFGQSFPSGHALGAAAFWLAAAVVLLPLVRRRARPLLLAGAVAVAVVVAATRVLLGVHFLSDVLAGLVLGLGWTAVCTSLFALWRREDGRPVEPYEQGLEPALAAPEQEAGR